MLRLFYGLKKETQDDILDIFALRCGAKLEEINTEKWLSRPVSSDWFAKTLYPLACAWETYNKYDLCQYNNAECGTIYRVKRFSEIEKFWGKSEEDVKIFSNMVESRYVRLLEDNEEINELMMRIDHRYINGVIDSGDTDNDWTLHSILSVIQSHPRNLDRLKEIRRRIKLLELVPIIEDLSNRSVEIICGYLGIGKHWRVEIFDKQHEEILKAIKATEDKALAFHGL